MKESGDARLREFLSETLGLWHVAGAVEDGNGGAVAVIRGTDGTTIWIEESSEEGVPFRWLVRWRLAGEAPGSPRELHPRGCASLLGVLSAMRSALNVDRGSPLRVAARA